MQGDLVTKNSVFRTRYMFQVKSWTRMKDKNELKGGRK